MGSGQWTVDRIEAMSGRWLAVYVVTFDVLFYSFLRKRARPRLKQWSVNSVSYFTAHWQLILIIWTVLSNTYLYSCSLSTVHCPLISMIEVTLNTPALLFPTISLLLLAYTNRYIAISNRIRALHSQYITEFILFVWACEAERLYACCSRYWKRTVQFYVQHQ